VGLGTVDAAVAVEVVDCDQMGIVQPNSLYVINISDASYLLFTLVLLESLNRPSTLERPMN
jgi:hypothetical protein